MPSANQPDDVVIEPPKSLTGADKTLAGLAGLAMLSATALTLNNNDASNAWLTVTALVGILAGKQIPSRF